MAVPTCFVLRRGARAASRIACLAFVAAACADKALLPGSDAAIALQLGVARGVATQTSGSLAVDILAGYTRGTDRVALVSTRVAVAEGEQTIPVRIDLAPCLADRVAVPAGQQCPLVVDLLLLNTLTGAVLDSIAGGSHAATPGTTIQLGNVQLDPDATVAPTCPLSTPVFVAAQDGTGPWTRVVPSGGRFPFRVHAAYGAFLGVFPVASGGFSTVVYHGTRAQLAGIATCPIDATGAAAASVSGPISGVGAFDVGIVSVAGIAVATTPGGTSWTIPSFPAGRRDVIASRISLPANRPNRIVIRRSMQLSGAMVLDTINFNLGTAPDSAALAISGAGQDSVSTLVFAYLGDTLPGAILQRVPFGPGAVPTLWFGLPSALRQSSDKHLLTVTATRADGLERSAYIFASDVRVLSVPFGSAPPVVPSAAVIATSPVIRAAIAHSVPSEYDADAIAAFTQGTTGPTWRRTEVRHSAAFRAAAPGTAFTIPDLSTATGWSNAWGLAPGSPVSWAFSGTDGGVPTLAEYQDGAMWILYTHRGVITP